MPDLHGIGTVPLVSWLPDVPSKMYTGLQPGTKSCLIVLIVSLRSLPMCSGFGYMTRCYVPNVTVPEAARLGHGLERKGARFGGGMTETDLSRPRV